jgi:hypothetical protein
MQAIAEHDGEVVVLAAVDLADQLTRSNGWDELRSPLRHVWRHLLESPLLTFTADVISHAAQPSIRNGADIARDLDKLTHEWTQAELHAAVAVHVGTTPSRIRTTRGTVQRHRHRETVDILRVDDPAATLDTVAALAVFAEWAAMDRDRDYFRLDCPQPARSRLGSHESRLLMVRQGR